MRIVSGGLRPSPFSLPFDHMSLKYRADIDGLRAIAVLMVVIYHFKKNIGFNGFMGVDIFFVISGFLITSIIYNEAKEGQFSLKNFYERRIRRIFPALFTVILVSCFAAFYLFLPAELYGFAKSAITSIFFSSNILFYAEAGYFDASADLKPLLHTWSLAVEEQFYIVFPLIIMAVLKWKKFDIKHVIWGLFFVSFVAAVWAAYAKHHDAAFYMFPLRAWELMAGSLMGVGVLAGRTWSSRTLNVLSILGGVLIVAGLAVPVKAGAYFALHVFPVVIGTALIMYAGQFSEKLYVNRALGHGVMTFFGKISYSLYLWHWPIYVFAAYYMFDDIGKPLKVLLILLSIGLSYLSWRFVEQPFRRKDVEIYSRKNLLLGGIIIAFVCGSSAYLIYTHGKAFWHSENVQKVVDVQLGGDYPAARVFGRDADLIMGAQGTLEEAGIVLIGDSHAQAIAPAIDMIARDLNQTALMFRNECLIPPDLAPKDIWQIEGCVEASGQNLNYIREHPGIKTVILAQRWNTRTRDWYTKYGMEQGAHLEMRKKTLLAFIRAIETPGRKIIIFAQVPPTKTRFENVPSVYARMKFRNHGDMDILYPKRDEYWADQKDVRDVFAYIQQNTDVEIIWPHEWLCPENRCMIEDEGGFYYYDDDHLSRYGAERVSEIFKPYLHKSNQ